MLTSLSPFTSTGKIDLNPHDVDLLCQDGEKARIIGLVDMIVVPEPRLLDTPTVAFVAQPGGRGWIYERTFPIAEKGYGIALDETAKTVRARLVVNLKPNKWKTSNVFTDSQFDWIFCSAKRFPISRIGIGASAGNRLLIPRLARDRAAAINKSGSH